MHHLGLGQQLGTFQPWGSQTTSSSPILPTFSTSAPVLVSPATGLFSDASSSTSTSKKSSVWDMLIVRKPAVLTQAQLPLSMLSSTKSKSVSSPIINAPLVTSVPASALINRLPASEVEPPCSVGLRIPVLLQHNPEVA